MGICECGEETVWNDMCSDCNDTYEDLIYGKISYQKYKKLINLNINKIDIKNEKVKNVNRTLDIKRCYLPFELRTNCSCGKKCVVQLWHEYLSYPNLDAPTDVSFYCESCDMWFDRQIIVSLDIKEV